MEEENKKPLKQLAYEQLKAAIASGVIVPGVLYSEQWCASYLGVSRTPVREALNQLKVEKLIMTHPNRGITLQTPSVADIWEIIQARTAVEGYCAAQLAKAAETPAGRKTLEKMQRIHSASEKKYVDPPLYLKLDADFHHEMIAFVGNPLLEKLVEDARFRLIPVGYLLAGVSSELCRAQAEHGEILSAILSTDPRRAYDSLERYLQAIGDVLTARLKDS